MTIGLVLEGGAKRGIYTAGVLDVLLENGVLVDGVIGVSAGAIHGCSYVSLQKGRSIRYTLKYGNNYRFMSFRSWFLSGNVVDTKFCYHDLPEKLDVFDNEAFIKSKTKFYVTCSNLETGLAEHILCEDLMKEIDYLRASASLPIVSKIVEVGGMKLLDGGIMDSIPLEASQKLGFDKNIVVLTRPRGYQKKSNPLSFLSALIYRKYPKFVEAVRKRHIMYNQQLEYIEKMEKAGKVLVVAPSRLVKIRKMERNPDVVSQMYALGREDAMNILASIRNFL